MRWVPPLLVLLVGLALPSSRLRSICGVGSGSTYQITVRSEPPAAEVQVDGVRMGTTPVQLEVSSGMHMFRFTKAGYLVADFVAEGPIRLKSPFDLLVKLDPQP